MISESSYCAIRQLAVHSQGQPEGSLFNTYYTEFLGRSIKEDIRGYLTDIRAPSWRKLFSSSSISFSYSTLRWFPRKLVNTDFCDYLVDSSALLRALSNIGSFMSSLICRPSNIPLLNFSMLINGNFFRRKINPLPSQSIAFIKFFITPNLICKSGTIILFDSTRGRD